MKLIIVVILAICSAKTNGLLDLNDKKFSNTLVYKCPVLPDPMYTNKVDTSIIVFKNKTVANLLKYQSIIFSSRSNIMHEISYSSSINDYTFSYASLASLDYLLGYANVTKIDNQKAIIQNDVQLVNEDSIESDKYNELLALSKDPLLQSIGSKTVEIQNTPTINGQIYKSIGRQLNEQTLMSYLNPGLIKNITSNTVFYTSYLIVNANGLNYDYFNNNDVIFGNQSFGYLETIKNVDEITASFNLRKKLIIETKLAECFTDLSSKINNILNIKKLNTDLSELDCMADFNSSLYVMNLNLSSLNMNSKYELVNKLIPARKSASFGLKILTKARVGSYIVFEGISLNQLDKLRRTKLSLYKSFSYTWSKSVGYDATLGG